MAVYTILVRHGITGVWRTRFYSHQPKPTTPNTNRSQLTITVMKTLCQNNNLLPRDTVRLDRSRNDLLGTPVRVVVRRVPRIDAEIKRRLQDREGIGFFETPREPASVAEGHGAEDGVGDAEAGGTELDVGCFCSGGRHGVGM